MVTYQKVGDLISKAPIEKCGNKNFPVLSMTMREGIVFQNDRFKKQIASIDQSTYNVVRKNQLVVSFPIDEGVLAVQDITDAGIVSPAYKIWNVDERQVAPKYLELFLRSPHSIQYYKSKLRGTTARRRSITDLDLLDMDIPRKTLEEQSRIIENISKSKNVIHLYQQQLEKFDELIKARFVEMFGDPVENPIKWAEKPLLEIGSCKNGMNFHYEDCGVNIHCLGVGDFKDLSKIDDTTQLPIISLNEMPTEEYLLQNDDIVFVRSNGNKALVGRSIAVYPNGVPTTFSGFCIRFRKSDSSVIVPYLLRVLKTDSIRKKMAGRGANIQNLNQQILSNLLIPVPPLDLQNQFASFVEQLNKSKVAVQKALDEAQLLFDSLMQEYFG